MPELELTVGDRIYTIACQEGEEAHLKAAAKLLDKEAGHVTSAAGRLPESRVLLMAGLMLADQLEAIDDKHKDVDGQVATLEARIKDLEKTNAALKSAASAGVSAAPVDLSALDSVADDLETALKKLEARA